MASYAGLLELRGPHGHTVRDFPTGKTLVGLLGRVLFAHENGNRSRGVQQVGAHTYHSQACWRWQL